MNIERLRHLRDVVIPNVETNIEYLNFSRFYHWCGTPSCLLGFATVSEKLKEDGWRNIGNEPKWDSPANRVRSWMDPYKHAEVYYGISASKTRDLFASPVHSGISDPREDLEHRKVILDNIIARAEKPVTEGDTE